MFLIKEGTLYKYIKSQRNNFIVNFYDFVVWKEASNFDS